MGLEVNFKSDLERWCGDVERRWRGKNVSEVKRIDVRTATRTYQERVS